MREWIRIVLEWEYLGSLLLAVLCVTALTASILCLTRLRRIQKRLDALQGGLETRLNGFIEDADRSFAKERHILSESISGMSETLTRVLLASRKENGGNAVGDRSADDGQTHG